MRRRHLYVAMFAVPALLAAALFSILLFAITMAVLWTLVLGDNTWPDWIGPAVITAMVVAGGIIFLALMTVAYDTGRKAEGKPELNRRHVVMAGSVTVALVALVIAFRLTMDNLNPPTPETACSDLCRAKGFGGSVMPPRDTGSNQCTCIDSQGRHALTLELPSSGPHR